MAMKLMAVAGVILALVGILALQTMPDSRWHGEAAIGIGIVLFVIAWVAHWKRRN